MGRFHVLQEDEEFAQGSLCRPEFETEIAADREVLVECRV
jgi:hypothetical protein